MALFLIEVFIALFVNDKIIRPFLGDFLVVIFLYFLARGIFKAGPFVIACSVLVFSYAIEIGQYFKLVELMGLKDNRFAEIIIGQVFSWWDLVAYFSGIVFVYCIDTRFKNDA